ncbi:3-ketoacyl-CoA synthase 7-like [Typha angustifolia]|uniref:3-ketoacyl-CoA synthase 7-like n=1 Tax=Typha angustifolia TaxID=59011 RepID=UPI003C2CD23A
MENAHREHLLSSLLHLLSLLSLFLSLSIETYIFIYRLNPTYHLFPLLLSLLLRHFLTPKTTQTHLLDFSCLKPQPRLRVPIPGLLEHLSLINCFDSDSVAFMKRVITSSGMGNETYFPPSLHYIPPSATFHDSVQEAHMLFFPTLDDLFAKTNVSPLDIDILVVNCSGFCPSPSLSSIVVNRYAMRSDVKSFNLSGMGCAAGVVGVDVARSLLKLGNSSYAVVISTEIVSTGWYNGKDPRKLVLNCFFRMGCSAVLLTNRPKKGNPNPKYKLVKLMRTQFAYDDRAYKSASREEDDEGITGFSIERDLLRVAAESIRLHVVALGPSILPWREKLRYVLLHVTKKAKRIEFVPDFSAVIKHYCLPSSGKPIIKKIGKGLGLGEKEMEAALMTFHRFGNQSSASMWYQLGYLEAKGRVRKGDRVWQLGMGSGPKCNTLIWECVGEIDGEEEGRKEKKTKKKGPWMDCIHRYPIDEEHQDL